MLGARRRADSPGYSIITLKIYFLNVLEPIYRKIIVSIFRSIYMLFSP